jgi:SecD/SecF fusion protein
MIKNYNLPVRFAVIGALLVGGIIAILPLDKKINLGLDLRGGTYILLKADTSGLSGKKISDAISGAIEKVRSRIDAYGVKETSIQMQGSDNILVQLPGVVDRGVIDKLKDVGKLEFRIVDDDTAKFADALKGSVPENYDFKEDEKKSGWLLMAKEAAVDGADLSESHVGFDTYGVPDVKLQFTSSGMKKFAKITEDNVGKQMAILLDGRVISAPVIREPILTGQCQISGDFSMDQAGLLASVLNSGALPVPLNIEEERTVGPLLGSDSIKHGLLSSAIGIALVFLFMAVYYTIGGVVACICLALNLLLTMAGLALMHATLTLPGIAGLILSLAMAVDANVLIYERLRDELALKKPLAVALKNSYDRTFITIIDTHLTNVIAAVFLFMFGTGAIKGFATTLILGLAISMFTSIYVSKTILSWMLNTSRLEKMPMLQLFPKMRINFFKIKIPMFILSLVLIGFGLFSFHSRGENAYGVDFRGGLILEYKITPAPQIEDVRLRLSEAGLKDLIIQDFKDTAGGIAIRSKADVTNKVEEALTKNFPNFERLRVTKVGPAVGAQLKQKAILAILFSLLGIMVYVAFRFKHWDFAMAAVIGLLYDVVIAFGFTCVKGYEIDLLTITALLTIAGYSVADTIVLYDRVRELAPKLPKANIAELLNTAINEVFGRTVITTLTVLMVTSSMYFFGGEGLSSFSFALLIGFMSGIYSTIYISVFLVLLVRKSRV